MKRKILMIFMALVATICCALGLAACNGGDDTPPQPDPPPAPHTHVWSQTYTADGGRHYQTCSLCNTKKYSSHNYTDLICEECGRHLPVVAGTAGLEYTINEDNKSYSVTGLGTATETEITIASVYEGLPVTAVGYDAFEYCSSFTSIIIPDSVTSIGDFAFYYCSSLTSITIPDSVTKISYGAFVICFSLESISVEDGNPTYHSAGNCIIETESKTLIAGCKNSIIPTDGSVTKIGDFAFYGCTSLSSITIPDSVTSIGEQAFSCCSSLSSITIPDSVTSIGSSTFLYCTSLESITMPNSVTSIGEAAFKECTSLTSITIPDSVTSIGDGAFYGCSSLSSITIPDSVTSIGDYMFEGCSSLASFTIPNRVTSIGGYAFYGCKSLSSITIPNGVTSIGYNAFQDCTSLTSINFKGTKAQWKSRNWEYLTSSYYIIHCTDGNLDGYGNEIN